MAKDKTVVAKEPKAVGIIRVRGQLNITGRIKTTLDSLNLTRSNHCVVVPFDVTHKGMLNKVKDYVTWGEIHKATFKELIKRRGRLMGDAPITEKHIKEKSSFKSLDEFVAAVVDGKATMRKIEGAKVVFRLHPPAGGFKGSTKQPFKLGGNLGNRGEDINGLIMKMLEPRVKETTARFRKLREEAMRAKMRMALQEDSSKMRTRRAKRSRKRRSGKDDDEDGGAKKKPKKVVKKVRKEAVKEEASEEKREE